MTHKEESRNFIVEMEDILQEMEHLGISTQIKVPHGVMSYARTYQKKLSFLDNKILKKNLSYLLMLNEFLLWAVRRFSLVPGIKDMLLKNIIANYGFAVEAINKNIAKSIIDENQIGFDSSSSVLCENGYITRAMKKEIRWLYDIRNKQHYDTLPTIEFEHYTYRDCKNAHRIFSNYIDQIKSKVSD